MKYIANPVEVDARKIAKIGTSGPDESLSLILEDGEMVVASLDMMARYVPKEGDYWVIQADGYTYLNPKDVFERKYRPAAD